jgi:hypothetical protein
LLSAGLLAGALPIACALTVAPPRPDAETIAALERSLHWLEQHRPDPENERLGYLTLDAMAWHVFAAFHPDARTRRGAGEQLDERLRAMPLPGEPEMVPLSYWAVALRIASIRGVDLAPQASAIARWDIDALIGEARPHTAWWIDQFLHRSGIRGEPDFSKTLLASGHATPETDYRPNKRDAYRLFHELVPLTDFGREPATPLEPEQLRFARRVVPQLIEVSRHDDDTDAVAEALVCSALLGLAETQVHRDAVDWLLARSNNDGTYFSRRDRGQAMPPSHYRHVVLTASWALLATLDADR